MQYTQAQIDRANAVSLEDFLRTQGETLIKSGREYRWKEHDSLTVRGNKWFRHSQSKGGYPIDFVMEFYGKSFPEAVQLLTGESGEGQTEATTAPPTAFHLPLHNRTADRAIQYLCESRGLNKTLVEAFLLSGDIYEDAKRHNVVFVGRDRSGTPRYAHVRGTADPFRQDIAGSDKSYPFHYEGNGNQLFVFEAPMIYTQLIQTLYRQADRIHKGRLPVPVHCLMDEYANLSLPKDTFLSALATMRSRGIFCSIIVQNMAQLKAMYKDDWESLVGLCDEFLYLGGTEKETHKYVSELLGKETISTTSYNQSKGRSGSYSINHQQSGRDMPYLFVKSSVALNLS